MSETKQKKSENKKPQEKQENAGKTAQKKTAVKKPQPSKTPKVETVALDELNLKVINAQNEELINESGNTVVCLLMQRDGRVLTSFMGDYNKEILTTLDKVLRKYFKSVKKHLLSDKLKKEAPQTNNKSTAKKEKTTTLKNENKK